MHQGLLVPPAWSLSLELSFYVLAPFIIRSKKRLTIILILSLFVKIFLEFIGIAGQDPWSYRFFPAELSIFLLGASAHQFLGPRLEALEVIQKKWWGGSNWTIAVLILSFAPLINCGDDLKTWLLIFAFTFMLPTLFKFQTRNAFDKALAELSYPMYLWHFTLLMCLSPFISITHGKLPSTSLFAVCSLATLVVSWLTNLIVGRRVEALRERFRPGRA